MSSIVKRFVIALSLCMLATTGAWAHDTGAKTGAAESGASSQAKLDRARGGAESTSASTSRQAAMPGGGRRTASNATPVKQAMVQSGNYAARYKMFNNTVDGSPGP